jgi:hypothetical protein
MSERKVAMKRFLVVLVVCLVFGGCMAERFYSNDYVAPAEAAVSAIETSGGWSADDTAHTWTLDSTVTTADADVYVVNVNADVTGYIGPNMKVRLKDGGVTKYFGVLTVGTYSAGVTPLRLFGGTDYVLSGTITEPAYSYARAPFGWPVSEDKWTITKTYSSNVTQSPVTLDTWYEFGDVVLPAGNYRIGYRVLGQINRATGYQIFSFLSTLATTSAAETDKSMTDVLAMLASSSVLQGSIHEFKAEKYLAISSETTYYLNLKSVYAVDSLYTVGVDIPTVIYAVWGGL